MNTPIIVNASDFQGAWAQAIIKLEENKWSVWNLVVQIKAPGLIDRAIHTQTEDFARLHGLIKPNQVAYTIFPFKLYKPGISRERFYKKYWKYFAYTRKQPRKGWGAYFERMIRYRPTGRADVSTDQLSNIIDSIKTRRVNYGSSFVMIIPYPYKDSKRIMAAPCLNYVTVQVENTPNDRLCVNLLAVYRNHDFLERAYGNYYGLCKLLQYIASETGAELGCVTCVSSHAYVSGSKRDLSTFANSII